MLKISQDRCRLVTSLLSVHICILCFFCILCVDLNPRSHTHHAGSSNWSTHLPSCGFLLSGPLPFHFLFCLPSLISAGHSHSHFSSLQGPIVLGRKQKALQKNRSADFNPDFVFTEKEGTYDGSWALADVMSQLKKKVRLTGMGFRWWAMDGLLRLDS